MASSLFSIVSGAVADSDSFADLIAHRVASYLDADDGTDPQGIYQRLLSEIERPLIEQAMRRAQGNQVRAARILGLNRNTLRKKLVDLGIAPRKAFE